MILSSLGVAGLGLGLANLALGAAVAAPTYQLVDNYDASNFFSSFDFFTARDPTNGFVQYIDQKTATARGLASRPHGAVYLGVDAVNKTTSGRASVRLTSKKAYTRGLFIADIEHMPAGIGPGGSCGLWPAFWSFGPGWPNSGEIDILEGVHGELHNTVTLHTGAGCVVPCTGDAVESTQLLRADCFGHMGCTQKTRVPGSYGAGFNAVGGGVYALEWTDQAIRVWFFPRGSEKANELSSSSASASFGDDIPNAHTNTTTSSSSSSSSFCNSYDDDDDIDNLTRQSRFQNTAPNPSTFGRPIAAFLASPTCSFADHFKEHNLVFDTTFCGDWAGAVWADADGGMCLRAAAGKSCQEYVGQNPRAFMEAYWLIRSIKVYQLM
ncbi:hypothetical protein VTJ49DRAFT_3341 [Mycothermus thermophilus]|uniref:GH16 domain-containing protein n=1 Tax=Humicola insolens TaxID=85995 RepID=A0ABR3VME4_HUMIN